MFAKSEIVFVTCVCLLVFSCASSAKKQKPEVSEAVSSPNPSTFSDRVTISLEDVTLADIVKKIGEKAGGRFAVMNGLEDIQVAQVRFSNADFKTVAEKLSKETKCALQQCPSYFFFYWPGYEQLMNISLSSISYPQFVQKVDVIAFGNGMPLYAVFSWLGQALGTTIVADNAVAEARCGEIALRDIPLHEAIEAILKSARVAALEVDCTEDYLFISAPGNPNPRSCLLNPETLDDRQRNYLETKVKVILPQAPREQGKIRLEPHAVPLREVLPSLSDQLGILVTAEEGMKEIPINPVAFHGVSIRTVLDLLIRQWLVNDFGYQFTSDRIVLRRRTSAERLVSPNIERK
ncbi:MAG TPA: hypothetical protein PKY35_09945 [Candidatus Hydrogenedentes bacterium]|nr:hypothetical protein [Candidatus Hydrogenedentota bacterium]HOL77341.1 hypothetical protein [Candidatus Hydrogenedentota bacterium]HPO84841.1 hypothetical protein [Candidatus Hydrogenedentota bacterium]